MVNVQWALALLG